MDAAYYSSDIYDHFMDNTHAIPVIDTNRRRVIVLDRLSFNRKQGIIIRDSEISTYRLRWEMEKKRRLKESVSLETEKSVQN